MSDPEQSARLIQHFGAALQRALCGLTGREFEVTPSDDGRSVPGIAQPWIWEQKLSLFEVPAIWIVVARDARDSLARMTLEAAGISDASDEDLLSTWQEVINQMMSGVASALTADTLREVRATAGQEGSAEPAAASWVGLRVAPDRDQAWTIKVGWSAALTTALARRPEPVQAGKETKVSRTFDLLLNVALPVSVSFGKTALQIREILKLNSGSIVELNRLVSEPVDVVVNDCVIARGEVVVVDGNYGVRISQLASREDRLRSGIAEASAIAMEGR